MTPYHQYPRVSLNQCRCANCGNDIRHRLLDRLWEKKTVRYTPLPPYVKRRKYPSLFGKPKRAKFAPAYKLRRRHAERFEKLQAAFAAWHLPQEFVEV